MATPRIDYNTAFPQGVAALVALGHTVNTAGLEAPLLELVRLRASQMNGCSFCIDMHSKDAIAAGETTQRLFTLSAWHETPFFTPRERAALAWTEALTDIQNGHAPDAVYDAARANFSDAELVQLTLAITTINVWNRIAIAFRPRVGHYRAPAA